MNFDKIAHQFQQIVDELSDCTDMEKKGFFHEYRDSDPIPSSKIVEEIIELCRTIFFPGYYGKSSISHTTLKYNMGVNVERLYQLLLKQIAAGLCFGNAEVKDLPIHELYSQAEYICGKIISLLPEIRSQLETDVIAAYDGDPAAVSLGEVISCYPTIKALTNYRVAHELYRMNVPLIPRIITEMAHSETGIDIHPGAQIGRYFTIDHGTGVVIGATCIIGEHVKLYQGVTLGAKSFPLDEEGNPIKGIPRHPIIEDNVIVYSNATILGRITIGKGATIGGNVWVTEDVPAGSRIIQYNNRKRNE